jgi:hypothetical protein
MEKENLQPETPKEPEQELNFIFKVSETNLILAALEELPHKVSRRLIDNIFQQAQPQVKQPTA